ncbi:hypothetical protein HAX54_033157 [Datura stramonium]|uniref:Uncharacterized protein n=1 Tax=Datura stramonium TaxID=4076 RepID=A0ABS8VBW7_DATST|nr:hypothetical protein [Datura stramonium]
MVQDGVSLVSFWYLPERKRRRAREEIEDVRLCLGRSSERGEKRNNSCWWFASIVFSVAGGHWTKIREWRRDKREETEGGLRSHLGIWVGSQVKRVKNGLID